MDVGVLLTDVILTKYPDILSKDIITQLDTTDYDTTSDETKVLSVLKGIEAKKIKTNILEKKMVKSAIMIYYYLQNDESLFIKTIKDG